MDKMKELQAHLRELADGTTLPEYKMFGVCAEISRFINIDKDFLLAAFKAWPLFSGHEQFPVSHPSMFPGEAYTELQDLWDTSTDPDNEDLEEYIENRRDLCRFLADYLEEERE